ncbi:Fe-S cluster assembly ATPase SufC [Vallitaleaceae bacterium 9-2]
MELLNIKNLHASVEEKPILKDLNLKINAGEIHVVMGPNGAGKSTLAYTLMGHPKYEVTQGEVSFLEQDLFLKKVDERAKSGLFMSFQHPEVIPGVTVENFLRTAKTSITGEKQSVIGFRRELIKTLQSLNMDEGYLTRYLNEGFSGGEKKKNEILQMLTIHPKLAILDETDSGLDVDAIKIVAEGINRFAGDDNGVLVITHYNKLLSYIDPDYVHVLVDGHIVASGDKSLADQIDREGFESFVASVV